MPLRFAALLTLILTPSAFAGVTVVPEPSTMLLLAGGLGVAILLGRKHRKR